MGLLIKEIRHNRLLWLLAFVPLLFVLQRLKPGSHTLLFVLSVLAIVPLAALLSHATEAVAAKTGDTVGGLLNATLGNLTELVIALTALHAGQYTLVKASVAGAIVTNTLFMLGMSFLLGGLKHRAQEFSRPAARLRILRWSSPAARRGAIPPARAPARDRSATQVRPAAPAWLADRVRPACLRCHAPPATRRQTAVCRWAACSRPALSIPALSVRLAIQAGPVTWRGATSSPSWRSIPPTRRRSTGCATR